MKGSEEELVDWQQMLEQEPLAGPCCIWDLAGCACWGKALGVGIGKIVRGCGRRRTSPVALLWPMGVVVLEGPSQLPHGRWGGLCQASALRKAGVMPLGASESLQPPRSLRWRTVHLRSRACDPELGSPVGITR